MTAPLSGTVWARVSCASPVPGGEIDDEVVERAPYYVNYELLDHSAHDGTAPYNGGIFSGDKAERHEFDIVIFKGQYFLPYCSGLRHAAHHDWHVGAVNIRVEQANRCALFGERDREVHANRCFAHAAFAAGYCDDVFDFG